MKKFPSIFFSTFLLAIASFGTNAKADDYGCNNGHPSEMGDGYAQIVFYNDSLELVMHESKILIPRESGAEGNNSLSFQEATVTMLSEGGVYPVELNMLAVFRKDLNELSLAISLDKAPIRTIEMTCSHM